MLPPAALVSLIFISYRREDSAPYAGRLYDRLTARFGEGQVFMDIDQIEPGEDFVQVIERKVGACETALVLIGKTWLNATDAEGRRRLDDPEDFVRLEVAAALQRKVRVVPVLVGGATMPRMQQLPEPLALLSRRNALEVSDNRFHSDVDRLIEALERARSPQDKPQARSDAPERKSAAATNGPSTAAAPAAPLPDSVAAAKGGWARKNFALAAVAGLVFAVVAFALRPDRATVPAASSETAPPLVTRSVAGKSQADEADAGSTFVLTTPAEVGKTSTDTSSMVRAMSEPGFDPFRHARPGGLAGPASVDTNAGSATLIDELRAGARTGSPEKQTLLALMLECDGESNLPEATRWYKLAAAKGYRPAQEALVALERAESADPAARRLHSQKRLKECFDQLGKQIDEHNETAKKVIQSMGR